VGHLRLGRLPKTRQWKQVVQLLDDSPEDAALIAASVVNVADHQLRELATDQSLVYCFWLLTRISWASRSQDFQESLSQLGIEVESQTPVLSLVSKLTENIHNETDDLVSSGHFSELSSLAFRRALAETVVEHSGSLFGTSVSLPIKHVYPARFSQQKSFQLDSR
jgi:hypothetical protein